MKIIILFVISLIAFLSLCQSKEPLTFKENHKFKVLQFTDLHFGIGSPIVEILNWHHMQKVMNHSKPDFAAISGDSHFYSCAQTPFIPPSFSKACSNWVNIPFKLHKVNYALALGNHDCEQGQFEPFLDYRTKMLEQDSHLPFSYSKTSDPDVKPGSNQYLPVFSSYNKTNLALVMWFFDTQDRGCMGEIHSQGCVEKNQIDWFIKTDKKLRELYGDYYISIAFQHIPPPEFVTMQREQKVYGARYEGVKCPTKNSGFVDSLISRKVNALFVGHDHNNDFGGFQKTIELAQGRKSGAGAYGDLPSGGRVIEVREIDDDKGKRVEYEHYVMEHNGRIVENGPAEKRTDSMPDCPLHMSDED